MYSLKGTGSFCTSQISRKLIPDLNAASSCLILVLGKLNRSERCPDGSYMMRNSKMHLGSRLFNILLTINKKYYIMQVILVCSSVINATLILISVINLGHILNFA